MKKIILHLCFISLILQVKSYQKEEESSKEKLNDKYTPVFNYEIKQDDFPKFSIEKLEFPESNILTKETKVKLRARYEGNLEHNNYEFYLDIVIENENKIINQMLFCEIKEIEQSKNYVNFICGFDLQQNDFIKYENINVNEFGIKKKT